jgi:hypothetical protein
MRRYRWQTFRVVFEGDGGTDRVTDYGSFEEAVRAVRRRDPSVEFPWPWDEFPRALNGDKLSGLRFAAVGEGRPLGALYHIRSADMD